MHREKANCFHESCYKNPPISNTDMHEFTCKLKTKFFELRENNDQYLFFLSFTFSFLGSDAYFFFLEYSLSGSASDTSDLEGCKHKGTRHKETALCNSTGFLHPPTPVHVQLFIALPEMPQSFKTDNVEFF